KFFSIIYLYCFLNGIKLIPGTNQQINDVGTQKTCSVAIPKSWSVSQLSNMSRQKLLFSYARMITKNKVEVPIIQKCVTLYSDKTLRYHVYGHLVNSKEVMLVEVLDKTEALPNILDTFERMNVCSGMGTINVHYLQVDNVFKDYLQQWHHNNCSLISKSNRCDNCLK
ncbi:PREDICTED: uncharacterized protein LOC105566715, partial [Vollenhovia emeryi]|uniref:uncharacterized protein LOC105566715 n=1 Tax=Vollenhovia emeryi TaxID=411798 RepID=UPI0005F4818F